MTLTKPLMDPCPHMLHLTLPYSRCTSTGNFCYAFKFGTVTNRLGIVRDISFYNRGFLDAHLDIIIGKKSDSPDGDKSLADSKALIPVLKHLFRKHFPAYASQPCSSAGIFDYWASNLTFGFQADYEFIPKSAMRSIIKNPKTKEGKK